MHPSTRPGTAIAACLALLAPSIAVAGTAPPQAAPYAAMAPIAAYRMASQADEIALARSAAPPSIADAAEVLTLGPLGYETAAKGTNGFVCIVERAWASDFDDAGFWNPKNRAPNCFNPAAVRSVLPTYLERTRWVLAGASKAEMIARTMAAIAAGRIGPPEAGAMCFMMSKDQYLGDGPGGGHWHPHLMVFLPRQAGRAPDWGANLPGSPVFGDDGGLDPAAVYFIPVGRWSDGTAAAMPM
jgi:hypothetical protein